MNAKTKDLRPKVISINQELQELIGLKIAAKEDILWPCHAFNITIPNKNNRINVFEETVLKITELESGNTEKISNVTCLKKDLVSFIQNRLRQIDLLDDRYELSENGKKLLEAWKQNKLEENLEYTSATIFVDLISGKILPYVNTEDLQYKKIIKCDSDRYIYFLNDPTNENTKKYAIKIAPPKSFDAKRPNPNDIIRAIRAFKKKYQSHALLRHAVIQSPPPVPTVEAISVHDDPELVFLHCQALIQKGNSDLVVTDGCGMGFSESFANYLTSCNMDWVIDLKNKGVIDNPNSEYNENNEHIPLIYPHTAHSLRRAHDDLIQAEKIEVNSSNKEQELTYLTGKVATALYEALEWAVRYVVSENHTDCNNYFSSQSYQCKDNILQFAMKIGFDVSSKDVAKLLNIERYKFKNLDQRTDVAMQPLLAMAIVGAIFDSNHPMHHLAIEDPTCLYFIQDLKEKGRDPIYHGSSIDASLTLQKLKNYYDRSNRIIQALIPELTEDKYSNKTKIENDIDQSRLRARTELDKSLGLGFVKDISTTLREELIKIVILYQKQNLNYDQKKEYINLLASAMQRSLFEITKDRRSSSIPVKRTMKQEAIEKIVHAGFYQTPNDVPEEISTVNNKRLTDAVHGSNQTLGAQILALFMLGSESELNELKDSEPNFVRLVADLIKHRGHGNELHSDFSRNDMESWKNDVFKSVKRLTEIF